jgi:hypothetical protein
VLVSPAVDRRNAERARVLARLPILTELARKRPAAHDRIACLVGCGKSKGDAPAPGGSRKLVVVLVFALAILKSCGITS